MVAGVEQEEHKLAAGVEQEEHKLGFADQWN